MTLWSRDPADLRRRSRTIAPIRSICRASPLDAGIEAARRSRSASAPATRCCWSARRRRCASVARAACRRRRRSSSAPRASRHRRGLLMPEVLDEVLPGRPIAMLSGPSFAEEAIHGLPTAVSIATVDPALGRTLAGSLAAGAFRPYWTHDVLGVALGGAVKNVLAIAAGIVEGRGLGHNAARRAGHARLRRNGAARAGDGRRARDADRAERPRRPGADLPRPAVAQPLAGRGAGQGHAACRLHGRPPAGRRRRGDGAGGPGAGRTARKSRCRFVPPSMLSCTTARTSTRRSAPCWRVRCGAKRNEDGE